jgi:hypothetical protein
MRFAIGFGQHEVNCVLFVEISEFKILWKIGIKTAGIHILKFIVLSLPFTFSRSIESVPLDNSRNN